MWKRNKGVLIITTLIAALPILVGLILWNQLPDQMATHFNIAGEADGWSGKAFAVIGLPMILVGVHLICALATLADPKKQNISDKMFRLVLWICPVLSIFVNGGVYLYSLGFPVDMSRICMIMVSWGSKSPGHWQIRKIGTRPIDWPDGCGSCPVFSWVSQRS